MDDQLLKAVMLEEERGQARWGHVDRDPNALLAAAIEELGEVAHAINHREPIVDTCHEIAETMGVLSRLWAMIRYGG